jgi:phosphoglycolate phosphatase-like HAD superfamily hydrolase
MKLLVLDFDGVISDSLDEVFLVAMRSYRAVRPASKLRERDEPQLRRAFRKLIPLGNRAEDYGTALAALDEGVDLPDQSAYDAYRAAQDSAWLESYHRAFYEAREALFQRDPEGWASMMQPYAPLPDLFRRRAQEVRFAIATSKDRRSVEVLLDSYGIAHLFPPERILDKETGRTKDRHLSRLRELLGLPFAEMTFVDDKVNHLDSVAPLGVRCALAAWGHNGRREHELARRRGYLLCTLENVEQKIFGSA